MQKPSSSEYTPFFKGYISLVGEGDYFTLLEENTKEATGFFGSLSQEMQHFRYKPGKWTLKEVLMHLIDTERVMSYRALVIARGDLVSILPSMDQDLFAAGVNVEKRTMKDILEEFIIVRKSTVKLFEHITPEQSLLAGNVFGNPLSPRALGYIIIGHLKHHINTAREKYLGAAG